MTPQILDLCRELNPAVRPAFLGIAPEPGCEPNDCFQSVQRKVMKQGGRMQFGWAIWEWPHVFIEAEHHAVYVPPEGPPWADISPSAMPDVTRRLFLPDDTATYDFENEGIRRDNVRRPLADDPLILRFLDLNHEMNSIMNTIPGVGRVTLSGDAAVRYQRNVHEAALIEMQLLMKYTSQNAPCFCGSGQKFKRCHGQARIAR